MRHDAPVDALTQSDVRMVGPITRALTTRQTRQNTESGLSFQNPTKHELAVHEAGHAYAFAALCRLDAPFELGLGRDETGNHGWCNRRTLLLRNMRLASVPPDCLEGFQSMAAAEIMIAIAGPIAEFRRRHRSRFGGIFVVLGNAELFLKPGVFDVDGDFERIRSTLDYIQAPDPLASFRRLIAACDEIVARNWQSIILLSRRLLEAGLLGEDELGDWFEAHPAKLHPGPLTI